MIKVVGVRFRQAGKIYYFDPKNLPMKRGTHVIVETARGVEYGTVIRPPKQVADQMGRTQQQIRRYRGMSYRGNLRRQADELVKIRIESP